MVGELLRKRELMDADVGEPPGEVTMLLRQLIGAAVSDSCLPHGADNAQLGNQVLLDLQIDGVRCVLARLDDSAAEVTASLSPREQEIARMVAKGYTNKTIAAVLEISTWTVSTHLRRVFAKLGVSSRAAMVAKVVHDGMLGEGPDHHRGPARVAPPSAGASRSRQEIFRSSG
jgi:DNA-binding CsgD family transcriptional regulator